MDDGHDLSSANHADIVLPPRPNIDIDQHREVCDECGAEVIFTQVSVPYAAVSDAPPQIETHVQFWRKQCMRVERHSSSGRRGVNVDAR